MENEYDFNKLNYIREQIESMSKFNQIEILRILTKNKHVIINENKNTRCFPAVLQTPVYLAVTEYNTLIYIN